MAMNQCDGCRLGWPIWKGTTTHVPPGQDLRQSFWNGQAIGCTKDRYAESMPVKGDTPCKQ